MTEQGRAEAVDIHDSTGRKSREPLPLLGGELVRAPLAYGSDRGIKTVVRSQTVADLTIGVAPDELDPVQPPQDVDRFGGKRPPRDIASENDGADPFALHFFE